MVLYIFNSLKWSQMKITINGTGFEAKWCISVFRGEDEHEVTNTSQKRRKLIAGTLLC